MEYFRGRTVFYYSSTEFNYSADKIIMLHEGRIEEQGTHNNLWI